MIRLVRSSWLMMLQCRNFPTRDGGMGLAVQIEVVGDQAVILEHITAAQEGIL